MANPRQFLTGVDFVSNKGINLASPTAATDAANKAYVDAIAAGLEWKVAVRVATTTNGTLATAYANGSTVDTITLATGDRILLKNQTTQTENGIYTVNASGAPTRAVDANTTAGLNNATVLVLLGSQADTAWTQTTANPTIGSSNIVFAQFGAGNVYTALSTGGLTLSAGAFSVLLPGSSGLATSASGLVVQLDTSPGLVLGAGGIKVLLGSNPGLTLTGGLAVLLDPTFHNSASGLVLGASGLKLDASSVPGKFSQSVGNASLTTFAITHGLGTSDVIVQVYDNSSLAQVEADVVHTSSSVVTVNFAVAPTTNQYRIVVLG